MTAEATSADLGSMAVWVERADGTILRGRAQTVSARGARVLLEGRHDLRLEESVRLRICFSPDRPTVAASAQVRWTRPLREFVDCALDWDLVTAQLESGPA